MYEIFTTEKELFTVDYNMFQAGKSCKIPSNNHEIALAAFDREGAFDNTSFESLIRAVKNRGVENIICNWVKTMLHRG